MPAGIPRVRGPDAVGPTFFSPPNLTYGVSPPPGGIPVPGVYLPRRLGPGAAGPTFFAALQPVVYGMQPQPVPLRAGAVWSGGWLRDPDGRRIVTLDQLVGAVVYSGGQVRDADGRTAVIVEGNQ